MVNESRNPDIKLSDPRLDIDEVLRENVIILYDALVSIQEILVDIDARLKELE